MDSSAHSSTSSVRLRFESARAVSLHWHERSGLFRQTIVDLIRSTFESLGRRDLLLDLGCGNGTFTVDGGRLFERAVGVDLSAMRVAEARRRARGLGLENHTYRRGDFLLDSFDDLPPADGVLAILVLEMLPDPADALRRLAARLRSGGRALVVIPVRDSWHMRMYRRWEARQPTRLFYNGLTVEDLCAHLGALSLERLATGTFHRLPPMLLYRFDSNRRPAAVRAAARVLGQFAERLPVRGSYAYLALERP